MIKVLRKTFELLEYVARRPEPVLPSEAARVLNLSLPTCNRILGELCEYGYLEQSGARKGYAAGPLAFELGRSRHYRNELYEEIFPQVKESARKIGQSVLFAVRCRDWRYILCHYNYNASFYVDTETVRHRDFYDTATGRVLLANTPEKELEKIIRLVGLPPEREWRNVSTSAALKAELEKIRLDGMVEIPRREGNALHVYAVPVFRRRQFLGALGTSWPVGSSRELCEECKRELDALRRRLSGLPAIRIPVKE